MVLVGEGIYVGSKTRRRRGVNTSDMVVDTDLVEEQLSAIDSIERTSAGTVTHMLAGISDRLLEDVDEVWRTEFAEGNQLLGAGFNCLMQHLLGDPGEAEVSAHGGGSRRTGTQTRARLAQPLWRRGAASEE